MGASGDIPRTVGCSTAFGRRARMAVHASAYGAGSWRAGPPTLGSSLWLCTMAAPRSRHSSPQAVISAGVRGTCGFVRFWVLPLMAASMITGGRPGIAAMMLGGAVTCNVRPMRAVLCKAYGPPESLVVEEIDEPTAGPGQIVVDVKACAINFPDVLMIQDLYQFKPPLPFSPGGEIAGVVSAVGEGVDGFSVGEAVFSGVGSGGLREKVALKAS